MIGRAAGIAVLLVPLARAEVTFADIQPIVREKCAGCHRAGEIGPMPLTTYRDARPWAKAIRDAVLTRKMPPWPADPRFGNFRNDHRLTDGEIAKLSAWVEGGAPEGPAIAQTAGERSESWAIPPDKIISLPEFSVPANGVVELTDITIPSGFAQDMWITSIEIRPGNRGVVHHVIVEITPHSKNDRHGVWNTPQQKRDSGGAAIKRIPRSDRVRDIAGVAAVWVPGAAPADYRVYGAAKLIPAGSDLLIQMHYTPKGGATVDRTEIGLTFAPQHGRGKPARRYITVNPTALRDAAHFRIPAGDSNWEARTQVVFLHDAQLVWMLPHMHLRGKDMTYRLRTPGGEPQTLLSVKWNFDWQLGYELAQPIEVPKGSILDVTAHFDNSPNNKRNPNPDRDVYWGDQTWEEMMVPWFGLVADRGADPEKIVSYPKEVVAWRF